MRVQQVRETMQGYVEELAARGDFRRFFAEHVEVELVGTDQGMSGAEAAEQGVRFIHEVAFDARPEVVRLVVDEQGAALEAVFVGTHIGEFAGIPAAGNSVRVPYTVFYDVAAGAITALRIHLPMEQLVAQISEPATQPLA